MTLIKKMNNHPLGYIFLLILVGATSYLYQMTQMGFYWDDWQAVFLGHINNPQITAEYFSYDRPFSAWTYDILFPWLPMNAALWQGLSFLLRLGAIVLLVEALLQLWPNRKWQIRWVGLILFVYPAFTMQPVAVAFSQHFTTFFLFALSLLFTGLSLNYRSRFWIFLPLALVAAAGHLFTMEYFLGLEAIRVIYIYFLVSKKERKWQQALRQSLLIWLPYLIMLVLYLFWRLAIYPSQIQGSLPNDPVILKQLFLEPGNNLLVLLTRITKDSIYLMVNSWVNTIAIEDIDFRAKATLFSWGVGLVLAVIAACWLMISSKNQSDEPILDRFYSQGIVLGIGSIVFGGLPVWLIARQITEGKWSDRFSLAPMIGAVLIIVIVIDWLIRTNRQKQVLLAILLAMSVAFQIRNVNKYRLDWDIQRNFYWQLYWRIPAIEPGTAFFAPNIPSGKIADYAAAYGINIMYADENLNAATPYWFFTQRDEGSSFAKLEPGHEIKYRLRSIQFSGTTSNAIALYYQSSSRCLKILDPIYQADPFLKTVYPAFFNLTNYSQIISPATDQKPDENIFGKEPAHEWCYYFQKADLARQNQQWQDVIDLMGEAFRLNHQPAAASEFLPLLEAYLYLNNWDQALATANQMIVISEEIKPAICSLVESYDSDRTVNLPEAVQDQLRKIAECK